MKKVVSLFMVLLILGVLFAGCTKSEDGTSDTSSGQVQTGEKEKVSLRLADMSVYGIAIFNYAKEIGLLDKYFDDLEKYDISVELSEWASGPAQNEAFAAGEIDFSSMGNLPAVSGSVNGYGTKILAVNYLYDNEYFLVARVGSGIETIADLKGKNVGSYVGTVQHFAIAKYLETAGLTVDDVNLLNVAAETVTSLRTGDIDAATLGNVTAHQLIETGDVYILSEDQVPIYNYTVGREEFAKKYPDIAVRVLKLINDTWAYALEHKDEYMEFYATASGIELDVVKASMADNFPIKSAKDFDDNDYAQYVAFIDWMKSVDYVSADVNPDDLLDLTYVKQLK
ncbi:ABC transporter substrate-binding protein [Clostridia bacterium]|nr:ABC transporter substrate-binding protein [Clostridia bacterium]